MGKETQEQPKEYDEYGHEVVRWSGPGAIGFMVKDNFSRIANSLSDMLGGFFQPLLALLKNIPLIGPIIASLFGGSESNDVAQNTTPDSPPQQQQSTGRGGPENSPTKDNLISSALGSVVDNAAKEFGIPIPASIRNTLIQNGTSAVSDALAANTPNVPTVNTQQPGLAPQGQERIS
jgi:hypothetical protein